MGGAVGKSPEELEAEIALKISLRPWRQVREYRDYDDYSLHISLGHWGQVGDLIRVKQLLKEVKKRQEKAVEKAVEELKKQREEEKDVVTEEELKVLKRKIIADSNENLCRLAFQAAIQSGQIEVLEMFISHGISPNPIEFNSFVKHPLNYCRKVEDVEYLVSHGVDLWETPSSPSGIELQKAILHHGGNGLGSHVLLQHLFKRSIRVAPDTAMTLLNRALDLITKTQYSIYLERLVYYGVDMKVEFDIAKAKLDKDALAREFIRIYLDILEMEEPDNSYDAAIQTQHYRQQYPVVRRLFASGFLRSSLLRQKVEPLFEKSSPQVELVIRAAMVGHKRSAQEMHEIRSELLTICIDLPSDKAIECFKCNRKLKSVIVEEKVDTKIDEKDLERLALSRGTVVGTTYRSEGTDFPGSLTVPESGRPGAFSEPMSISASVVPSHVPVPLDVANLIVEMLYGYV